MQYMMIIKSNDATEQGAPADDAFISAMEAFNQKLRDAGAWAGAEGFQTTRHGAILTLEDGEFTVEKGPYGRAGELIAGFWLINVSSKDEALDWAMQVPMLVEGSSYATGDGQIELLQVMEFPDGDQEASEPAPAAFGGNGASTTKRFIGMFKASPETEAGEDPGPEIHAAMGQAIGKFVAEGRFESGGGLMPTSHAARVVFHGGSPVVTDGPFAETREVIAGYAIFRADSLDQMIEESKTGLEIEARWRRGPIVSEIRELA